MEDKEKRRQRNLRYKENKNRLKLAQKIIPLFLNRESPISEATKRQIPLSHYLNVVCISCFIVALTAFLLIETIRYFSEIEGGGFLALLKGCLVEGVIIGFSFFQFDDFSSRCLQRFVLISMGAYSLWTVSSGVLIRANQDWQESQTVRQMVADTETQIRQKQVLTDNYLTHRWLGAARASQKDVDVLGRRLTELRQRFSVARPPQVIVNTVLNLVVFRLLIMVANILFLRRLKSVFRRITDSMVAPNNVLGKAV